RWRRAAHRLARATAPRTADQHGAVDGDDDWRLLAIRRLSLLLPRAGAERDPKRTPAGAAPHAVSRRSESSAPASELGRRRLVRVAQRMAGDVLAIGRWRWRRAAAENQHESSDRARRLSGRHALR